MIILSARDIPSSPLMGKFFNFYRPQRSWGKVIFSEACVKNSVGGGGGVWQGGMHDGGTCVAGGMHGRGVVCVWWGACMAGGVHGIQSMNGRYASYWNAFLLKHFFRGRGCGEGERELAKNICLASLTRAKCGTRSTLCWKNPNISISIKLFAL